MKWAFGQSLNHSVFDALKVGDVLITRQLKPQTKALSYELQKVLPGIASKPCITLCAVELNRNTYKPPQWKPKTRTLQPPMINTNLASVPGQVLALPLISQVFSRGFYHCWSACCACVSRLLSGRSECASHTPPCLSPQGEDDTPKALLSATEAGFQGPSRSC